MTQAVIITIGDELLIGQVIDTNSAWIAQHLNDIGINVSERIAVGDDAKQITNAVDVTMKKADVIIVTGGLGPTRDDITKEVLTKYFGGDLVVNEEIRNDIKEYFSRTKRPMLESNLKQAELPSNAKIIYNKRGTAAGMWFERDEKILVSLPGVPYEMTAMMEEHVLSELKKRFHQGVIIHKTIMTCGIGESFLADKIKDWENNLPSHITLAYLPNLMQVRLRLTAKGNDEEQLKHEVNALVGSLMPLIKEHVFGLDEISIEEVVGELLKEQDAFVSTAESCTGGFIAHKLTMVAGASDWFKGSFVTYSEESKTELLRIPKLIIEKHGVVSKQVVKRMAKRVAKKMGTQYAISVSGWCDPKFTNDDDPKGLVWIGWWDGKVATAKSYQFLRTRQQNIEMVTTLALDGLRRILLQNAER